MFILPKGKELDSHLMETMVFFGCLMMSLLLSLELSLLQKSTIKLLMCINQQRINNSMVFILQLIFYKKEFILSMLIKPLKEFIQKNIRKYSDILMLSLKLEELKEIQ